jgi:hypothetical protein
LRGRKLFDKNNGLCAEKTFKGLKQNMMSARRGIGYGGHEVGTGEPSRTPRAAKMEVIK